MVIKREWATPLMIGAFLLSGITGITLFFDINTLLAKNAHKYLGLLLVAIAVAHVATNFPSFKRYLQQTRGRIIVGIYAAILIATFIPFGPMMGGVGGGPAQQGLRDFLNASLNAPISDVAVIVHRDPNDLVKQLKAAGYNIKDPSQSVMMSVAGTGEDQQFKALNAINVLMQK